MNWKTLIVVVLLFAAALLAGRFLDLQQTDVIDERVAPLWCTPEAGPCTYPLEDQGELVLLLEPRDKIQPMEPLTARLESGNEDMRAMAITLSGLNMDMGHNRFSFRQSGAGFEAAVIIPVCTLARMEWEALVELEIDGRRVEVSGQAWLDREWSSQFLQPDQAGWDWFALQLDDGRELMYYQLRRHDGSAHPSSRGVLVAADGSAAPLGPDQVGLALARDGHHAAERPLLGQPGQVPVGLVEAGVARNGPLGVVLAEATSTSVLRPDETLVVRQSVAPLERTLERLGERRAHSRVVEEEEPVHRAGLGGRRKLGRGLPVGPVEPFVESLAGVLLDGAHPGADGLLEQHHEKGARGHREGHHQYQQVGY